MSKNYVVPEETINDILRYLGHKPYTEVSEIIAKIYSTARPEETEKE